jgi:L-threonylcarbamoyladenylate synthase
VSEIATAIAALAAGRLVAFPTETVYGLGADAENAAAVARIFAAKGRPADHPLIVHGASVEILDRYGREVPEAARRLAETAWPGPLTLVVMRSPRVLDAVTGGRETVGLRVPDQPIALELLAGFGRGVAAPSANPFGRTSATRAEHVRADLGDAVEVVLDGGPSEIGVESTILDVTTSVPTILRVGGLPAERIEELLGRSVERHASGPVRAPGMLATHYAPRARVELSSGTAETTARVAQLIADGLTVGVIALGASVVPSDGAIDLGSVGDVDEYARRLYDLLRTADARGLDAVVAEIPRPTGLGVAIIDRLTRAAATRRSDP